MFFAIREPFPALAICKTESIDHKLDLYPLPAKPQGRITFPLRIFRIGCLREEVNTVEETQSGRDSSWSCGHLSPWSAFSECHTAAENNDPKRPPL
jgi:hypothetical protein